LPTGQELAFSNSKGNFADSKSARFSATIGGIDRQNPPPNPSEIPALDVTEKFQRLEIWPISATIDINWSIFQIPTQEWRDLFG
jgi:hypothetical protein